MDNKSRGSKTNSRLCDCGWLSGAIAHRGLHSEFCAENGARAFAAAVEKGYPIETDVQLTKDGVLVCFHDDYAERVTGKKAFVRDLTLSELKSLKLCDSDENVPTFEELLSIVDGKVPLLVEIKMPHKPNGVEQKTLAALKDYNGKYAIQSFDPRVLARVRKINPAVVRGQLVTFDRENQPFLQYFALKHGLFNFLSRPDFLNVGLNGLPLKTKKLLLCWTVRSSEDKKRAESFASGYVFENITP